MSILAPTVSILASNQPNAGGFTSVCTSSISSQVVSFNYCIFPGANVGSSHVGVPNSLYNRTVNVGSANSSSLGSDQYTLFIDTSVCLPNYDYYVSVNALYTDSSQSEYSSSVLLPLSAGQIILLPTDVTLTRSPGTYNTQATITVTFTPPTAPALSTLSYTLGIQYIDGSGNTQFTLVSGKPYDNLIGGVFTVLTDPDGIDEAYVAIQTVRTVAITPSDGVSAATTVKATSELSNTVMAKDTDIPDPPLNLAVDYQYYDMPQEAILTWNAPPSADLTDLTGFQVYRRVGSGPFLALGDVITYRAVETEYEYTDKTVGFFSQGTVLSYYVKSINGNSESVPSNVVSITIVEPSSPPRFPGAAGLQVTFTPTYYQDVQVVFANPLQVSGATTYGYNTAFFTVNIIDLNPGTSSSPNPDYDTVIASQVVPYNSSSTGYSILFNNIPFYSEIPNVTNGLYEMQVWLNTYDGEGVVIIGQSATVEFTSGPRPVIYDINGEVDDWTSATGLDAFKVRTSTGAPLVDLYVVTYNTSTNLIENILLPNPTPRTGADGDYQYAFSNTSIPAGVIVLAILGNNAYGIGQRGISGQLIV